MTLVEENHNIGNYGNLCCFYNSYLLLASIWVGPSMCFSVQPGCPQSCKCYRKTFHVDCHGRRLISVPQGIPKDTVKLDLNNNRLASLTNTSFLGVPLLHELKISGNKITTIENGTFLKVPLLKRLDISNNPTNISVLEVSVFSAVPSIENLVLNNMKFQLHSLSFKGLQNTPVKYIDLSSNKQLCSLPNGTFSGLHNFTHLDMISCQCKEFNMWAFDEESNMTILRLMKNQLTDFPHFEHRHPKHTPVMPALEILDLSENRIGDLSSGQLGGLQNLKKLRLGHNDLDRLNKFLIKDLPNLEELHVNMNQIMYISESALTSASLKVIHLEKNNFELDRKHSDLFRKATNLKEIYMGDTGFANIQALETIFQNLTSLRKLNLIHMHRLTTIPLNMFLGLSNLTDLQLTNNQILSVNHSMFVHLVSLKLLYIGVNRIQIINATSFPKSLLKGLQKIQLGGNPFHCTCELFWFRDWLNSTKVDVTDLHDHFNQYKCASPQPMPLLYAPLDVEHCLRKPLCTSLRAAIVLSAAVFLLTLTFTAFHRYRWSIRYHLFHVGLWWHSRKNPSMQEELDDSNYTFDVFVSYNSADSAWVRRMLMPKLEPHFNLCLFERDWLVGHDIVDCTEESIELSRFTLLLVTNAYASSQWCQLELTMAQHNLFDTDNDAVILAIMEDIDPMFITPRLALEMKRKPYLEWTEDRDGQRLFWDKLKYFLKKGPVSSVVQSLPPKAVVHKLL